MVILACAAPVPAPAIPEALARADGYVYTIDVANLLLAAAHAGDEAAWASLLPLSGRVVRDDPSDPWTRGMVRWRWKEGEPWDASGTTEAVRLAEGLWRGGDRAGATAILRGYAQHAREDRGTWFIANYFNFGTRALATNSYLVDYAPDFLAEVAQEAPEFAELARRSCELVRSAHSPSGLPYDLVQPEIGTLFPDSSPIFSPNDVIQMNNAGTVAERAARCDPALARAVLRFADGEVAMARYGRTGEVARATPAGDDTRAILARLAWAVGDRDEARRLLPTDAGSEPYTVGEVTLARALVR